MPAPACCWPSPARHARSWRSLSRSSCPTPCRSRSSRSDGRATLRHPSTWPTHSRRKADAEHKERLEAELWEQLEQEERRLTAENAGLLAQYKRDIQQRIERNWIKPPSAGAGLECVVQVTQIPGGEVVDVRVAACTGDMAVVRSIEAAVHKASPLPLPPDRSLFERNLRLIFKPEI